MTSRLRARRNVFATWVLWVTLFSETQSSVASPVVSHSLTIAVFYIVATSVAWSLTIITSQLLISVFMPLGTWQNHYFRHMTGERYFYYYDVVSFVARACLSMRWRHAAKSDCNQQGKIISGDKNFEISTREAKGQYDSRRMDWLKLEFKQRRNHQKRR